MTDCGKNLNKLTCLACGSVMDIDVKRCHHCNSPVSIRKRNSIEKSWIYLITSIILFFPANLLPITYTSYLGSNPVGDTIMSNIVLLWGHKSYFIALVIFLASIITPLFKIIVLLYLLLNLKPKQPPILQTKIYHFIHFIGRWSMIDVFVVALLGALINGKLASITAGVGIFAFTGVVIFTMIAAESFDIRFLWDNYRDYARSKN